MPRLAKSERDHWLQGTTPQTKPVQPSQYLAGRPKFPKHLSPAARAEMKRACRLLEERGTLTAGDYATLTVYAEVYSRWVQAKAEVGRNLLIKTFVTDNNGIAHEQTKLNPLLKVIFDCESRLLSLAKSLGLTPIDREKVRPAKSGPKVREVVPGSIEEQMPHLFGDGKGTIQ